jgi:hypothetical protein
VYVHDVQVNVPAAAAQSQSLLPSLNTPQVDLGQLTTIVQASLLSIFSGQAGLPGFAAPPVAAPPPPVPPVAAPPVVAPPVAAPPVAAPAAAPLLAPALGEPPEAVPALALLLPAVTMTGGVPAALLPVPALVWLPLPPPLLSGVASLLQPGAARVVSVASRVKAANDVRFMASPSDPLGERPKLMGARGVIARGPESITKSEGRDHHLTIAPIFR